MDFWSEDTSSSFRVNIFVQNGFFKILAQNLLFFEIFSSVEFSEGDASKVTPSKYIKSMMMTTEQVISSLFPEKKNEFWSQNGLFLMPEKN